MKRFDNIIEWKKTYFLWCFEETNSHRPNLSYKKLKNYMRFFPGSLKKGKLGQRIYQKKSIMFGFFCIYLFTYISFCLGILNYFSNSVYFVIFVHNFNSIISIFCTFAVFLNLFWFANCSLLKLNKKCRLIKLKLQNI